MPNLPKLAICTHYTHMKITVADDDDNDYYYYVVYFQRKMSTKNFDICHRPM